MVPDTEEYEDDLGYLIPYVELHLAASRAECSMEGFDVVMFRRWSRVSGRGVIFRPAQARQSEMCSLPQSPVPPQANINPSPLSPPELLVLF
jgi:hypothetical protein